MPLDPRRVRAILFDVDGTLSDTDDLWTERLAGWFQPVHRVFPRGDAHAFARRLLMGLETPANSAFALLDWVELDGPAMRLLDWFTRHRGNTPSAKYWIIPGVVEMLANLSARLPLAVVSARDEAATLGFLDQFDLRCYFKAIATTHTCRHTKPFPQPVLWAAGELGMHPEDCLMVGDTTVDIRAGRAAGAQTLGVLCGFGTQRELRRAGADQIIATTAALATLL